MTRTRSTLARALSGIAAVSLAATGLAVVAASPAAAAPAVVYNSIPDPLPPAYSSLGFQATSTNEFGDHVVLGGANRIITDVTVGLTNWACENWADGANPCVSAPGSSFTHPITLYVYEVDRSTSTPAVGALITTVTEEKVIPFRPSADADECGDNRWYSEAADACYNGYNTTVTFTGLDTLVSNEVIVTVAYNTQSRGYEPIGVAGPYNSLNVSVVGAAPSVGSVANLDQMFRATTASGGSGVLTSSLGWSTFFGLALTITADSVAAIDPLTEVTVYERDVKPNETPETYTSWHEGGPSDRSTVFADGLHLGIGGPSTVIKGTDLSNPIAQAVTRDELRMLIERASVTVASGSVTYQVPVFFGPAATPSFTTLRSTSLTAGSHTFSQASTWATTQAFGSYTAQQTAPLGELIDALYAAGDGVVLAGYGVQADSLAVVPSLVWNGTRYTFTQPVIEACVPVAGPEVTNLALGGWDFSETRTQGSNEFTEDGLLVSTFGAPGSPDQRKAAGYAPIDIALSDIGSVELNIAPGFTGVRPSLQLGFDADGNGTRDAYLVGEPWAYGGGAWSATVNGDWADAKFWVTGSNGFGVAPGGGYPALGTLDQYLLANPEARITNYGYSLGSGVTGQALIRSITVGCVSTSFGFELETLAPPTTERLFGDDRYATAVEVSKSVFDDGEPDTVFIATGADFADALSAAPAAAAEGAPLLLTPQASLPAVVSAELVRLAPTTVVIVGGTGAVSLAVENAITALGFSPTVQRVSGVDRYSTSRAIADEFFTSSDSAFIATGRDFPDALAAGPAAAKASSPVVLVPGTAATVDGATLALLDDLGVETVYIAGGIGVVSSGIEQQLDALAGVDAERLAGDDRYETAVAINDAIFGTGAVVYLATGQTFADALAGGAAAANQGAPLYITPGACLPANVLESINDRAAETIYILGGTTVLSANVANLVVCN